MRKVAWGLACGQVVGVVLTLIDRSPDALIMTSITVLGFIILLATEEVR